MDMHFKSRGKKFFEERKPWRPDTKRFDYWKGVIEKRRTGLREKIEDEVKAYAEHGGKLRKELAFEFESLPVEHRKADELRYYFNLAENKIFAAYCRVVQKLNPKFRLILDEKNEPDIVKNFLVPESLDATLSATSEFNEKLRRYSNIREVLGIGNRGVHERLTFMVQMFGYVSLAIEMPERARELNYFAVLENPGLEMLKNKIANFIDAGCESQTASGKGRLPEVPKDITDAFDTLSKSDRECLEIFLKLKIGRDFGLLMGELQGLGMAISSEPKTWYDLRDIERWKYCVTGWIDEASLRRLFQKYSDEQIDVIKKEAKIVEGFRIEVADSSRTENSERIAARVREEWGRFRRFCSVAHDLSASSSKDNWVGIHFDVGWFDNNYGASLDLILRWARHQVKLSPNPSSEPRSAPRK